MTFKFVTSGLSLVYAFLENSAQAEKPRPCQFLVAIVTTHLSELKTFSVDL